MATGCCRHYGGFLIPQAYKYSIGATGCPQTALISFVLFYASCMVITWYFYSRRDAEVPC